MDKCEKLIRGMHYWNKTFVTKFYDYCKHNQMYHTWDGVVIDKGSRRYVCIEDLPDGHRSYVCGRAIIKFYINYYENRFEMWVSQASYEDIAKAMRIKRGYETNASWVAGMTNESEGDNDVFYFARLQKGEWNGDICNFPDGSTLKMYNELYAEELF